MPSQPCFCVTLCPIPSLPGNRWRDSQRGGIWRTLTGRERCFGLVSLSVEYRNRHRCRYCVLCPDTVGGGLDIRFKSPFSGEKWGRWGKLPYFLHNLPVWGVVSALAERHPEPAAPCAPDRRRMRSVRPFTRLASVKKATALPVIMGLTGVVY